MSILAEYQRLHCQVEIGRARYADIGLAVLSIDQNLFRFLNDIENRCFALLGTVNADAEINFFCSRIFLVLGDESNDGIRARSLQ